MQPTSHPSGPVVLDLMEWDLILGTRANALLHGSHRTLSEATKALAPYLNVPLHTASAFRWSLPDVATGTLLLEHVAECSAEQQRAALEWLDGAARQVQVVTTTDRPLFDLVKRGAFLKALYYRLNTIYVTLDSCSFAGSFALSHPHNSLPSREK